VEWVEVTGKTVEEAKEAALDQLGVDEDDAEFEILEEPKAGLFGRLRSEARVRARVMPTAPRPKLERRDRKRPRRGGEAKPPGAARGGGESDAVGAAAVANAGGDTRGERAGSGGSGGSRGGGDGGGGARGGGAGGGRRQRQGQEHNNEGERTVTDEHDDGQEGDEDAVEVAESFLHGLLETFGAPYSIEQRPLEDDLVELSVRGDGLGLLIGPRGQTLSAVQELARTVVQRRSRDRSGRIIVDIAGYRQARRTALEQFTGKVAAEVIASGVPRVLEPMPPADRKVVHDAANAIDGVTTSSEGEEPRRRVVISPEASD
jgi:spoIIIJ-associated protein